MKWRRGCLSFVALISFAQPVVTRAEFVIPPVYVGGQLGYRYTHALRERTESDANQTSDVHNLYLNLNGGTYIYQPWFALLGANIFTSFQQDTTRFDDGSDTLSGDQDRTTDVLGGGFNLQLFPKSEFPFDMYYQQSSNLSESLISDSRLEGVPQETSQLRETTRFGITQRFNPKDWPGRYRFRAETITNDNDGDLDSGDFFRLFGGHNLGNNQLDLDLFYEQIERETPDEETQNLVAELEHQYRSGSDNQLFVRNRLNLEDDYNQYFNGRTIDRQTLRFDHFTTWRPAKYDKLSMNGFAQLRRSVSENEIEDSSADSLQATASANYAISNNLSANGSLGLNAREYDEIGLEGARYNALAQLRYRSNTLDLGQFTYNWNTSGSAQADWGELVDASSLNYTLGHSIARRYLTSATSDLTFTANQYIDHTRLQTNVENLERESLRLDQLYSLRYSKSAGRTRFFSSLSYDDSRQLADNPRTYQSLNFQFSGNIVFNRASGFTGHISLSKNLNESTTDPSFRGDDRGGTFFSDEDALNGSLEYYHNRAFGVNMLQFRSTLRALDRQIDREDDNLTRLVSEQRVQQNIWENRLTYRIGLLEMRLIGTLSRYELEQNSTIVFQINRLLGGQF